jgi:hypothetical protein
MFMANENFDKVYDRFREESLWDDMYIDFAEDHDGKMHVIIDSHSDAEKFVQVVKETLELEDDNFFTDEILDVEVVYSDEYTTCSDCNKVIRTSPDSYHWQPDFYVGDGFIACNVCFNENEDYQEAYLEDKINDYRQAVNGLISEEQMEKLGFEKLDAEYQDGYYDRHDDPEAIYHKLDQTYPEIVFFISDVGQFHTNFVVFVRGEYETEEE